MFFVLLSRVFGWWRLRQNLGELEGSVRKYVRSAPEDREHRGSQRHKHPGGDDLTLGKSVENGVLRRILRVPALPGEGLISERTFDRVRANGPRIPGRLRERR
jgi:hypothetical protein